MLSVKTTVTVAGIAGVAFLGLGGWALHQAGRIDTLQAKLETERERTSAAIGACEIAQAGDVETINALLAANAECVAARADVAASGIAAIELAERARRDGWSAYYQLRREQERVDVEDEQCGDWSRQPVCAAVAERLHADRATDPAPASAR